MATEDKIKIISDLVLMQYWMLLEVISNTPQEKDQERAYHSLERSVN